MSQRTEWRSWQKALGQKMAEEIQQGHCNRYWRDLGTNPSGPRVCKTPPPDGQEFSACHGPGAAKQSFGTELSVLTRSAESPNFLSIPIARSSSPFSGRASPRRAPTGIPDSFLPRLSVYPTGTLTRRKKLKGLGHGTVGRALQKPTRVPPLAPERLLPEHAEEHRARGCQKEEERKRETRESRP